MQRMYMQRIERIQESVPKNENKNENKYFKRTATY